MISAEGIRYIKKWDSEPGSDGRPHLKAYRDSGGVWTIGYGQTEGVTPGMTISEQEANDWFRNSLKTYTAPLKGHNLSQNQVDALTSFSWNAGPGAAKKAVNLYADKGYEAMASYMRSKVKDRKGRTLKGLKIRREEELAMFGKAESFPEVARAEDKVKAIVDIKTPSEMLPKPTEAGEEILIGGESRSVPKVNVLPEIQLEVPTYQTQLGNIDRYKRNIDALLRIK